MENDDSYSFMRHSKSKKSINAYKDENPNNFRIISKGADLLRNRGFIFWNEKEAEIET